MVEPPDDRGSMRALDPYIPAIGRTLLLDGGRERRLSGTVLWTDIRGFTALSEQYVDRGPEGTQRQGPRQAARQSRPEEGGGSMRLEIVRRLVPAFILLASLCLLVAA